MNRFLIKLKSNHIAIFIYEDEEFRILRREGEDEQEFSPSFWEWFKEKINYEGEELSFVVISDRDDFEIPQEFTLSEKNLFIDEKSAIEKIKRYIDSNCNLITYPKIENFEFFKESKKIETISKSKDIDIKDISKTNIADIYRKETMEYRNDKR